MPLPDLRTVLNIDAASRIGGQTPGATSQALWSTRDDAGVSYVWNATSLFATEAAAGKLSGVSSYNAVSTNSGLLISQQIWITAAHIYGAAPVGLVVRFVAADGTVRTGTVAEAHQVASTDILVCRFAAPVHASITPVWLLPQNYSDYWATNNDPTYIFFTNQNKKIFIGNTGRFGGNDSEIYPTFPAASPYDSWGKSLIGGDSGNALWTYIDGKVVGLATHYTTYSSPSIAFYLPSIRAEILDAGGTVADFPQVIDHSGYELGASHGHGDVVVNFSFTINKPNDVSSTNYASVALLLAALNTGTTYGTVSTTCNILVTCYGGEIGMGSANWALNSFATVHGVVNMTVQGFTTLNAISDSNPYVATVNQGIIVNSISDAIGALTIKDIQIGKEGTYGTLAVAVGGVGAGSSLLTLDNLWGYVSVDVGAVAKTVFDVTAYGESGHVSLVTRKNCSVYVAINQNAGATIVGYGITNITASQTASVNDYHCSFDSVSTTGTIKGWNDNTYLFGTLNRDTRYCVALGPNSSTLGFTWTNGFGGTITKNAASYGNVTSDTTGTTYSTGGGGVNSKLNTDAWLVQGVRTIFAGSCLAGLGTITPTPLDYLGTTRPQLNLVDAGPFQIVRALARAWGRLHAARRFPRWR